MSIERRLFVTTEDPAPLLAALASGQGGFVPTRVPLAKGERVVLDVRVGDERTLELAVVVAERRMPRGRSGPDMGVVVKVVGEA